MDDLNETRPMESSRIDLDDPHEVSHWCKELGVSEDELRDVVKKVGSNSSKVKNYFNLMLSA